MCHQQIIVFPIPTARKRAPTGTIIGGTMDPDPETALFLCSRQAKDVEDCLKMVYNAAEFLSAKALNGCPRR
jgi:hypothetical protein